jgi:hypothetical protein
VTRELELFLLAHDASGSPLRRYLRPGIPESDVRARLESLGLTAPADLVELYSWHDGTDLERWLADGHETYLYFIPYAWFPSLELAVTDYMGLKTTWQGTPMYMEYLRGNDPGFGYWRNDWFPILESDKSWHAMECSMAGSSRIWHVFFEPSPPTEAPHSSLAEMVDWFGSLLRGGACHWDSERALLVSDLDTNL